MKLFKRREKNNVPPDVGAEDMPVQEISKNQKAEVQADIASNMINDIFSRLTSLSEQMGEIREMAKQNEKDLARSLDKAMMAVDIVKQVKPEALRADYQKLLVKIEEVNGMIGQNKMFGETVMAELRDLRRKAGIFIGTEALIKLNEEVKNDIIEVQKIASKVRMHADKSEQIYIDLEKEAAKNERQEKILQGIQSVISDLNKEMQAIKNQYSKLAKHSDIIKFKEEINDIAIVKEENKRISDSMDAIMDVALKNKDDVARLINAISAIQSRKLNQYELWIGNMAETIRSLRENVEDIYSAIGRKPKPSNIMNRLKNITRKTDDRRVTDELKALARKA